MQVEIHYGTCANTSGVYLAIIGRWREAGSDEGYWLDLSSTVDGRALMAGKLSGDGWSFFDLINSILAERETARRCLQAMPLGLMFPNQPGVH